MTWLEWTALFVSLLVAAHFIAQWRIKSQRDACCRAWLREKEL